MKHPLRGWRKLLVLVLSFGALCLGKLNGWQWIVVAVIFIGGNLLEQGLELVQAWIRGGSNEKK